MKHNFSSFRSLFVIGFSSLLAAGLALGGPTTPAFALSICVDPANTPTCFATIQSAIDASSPGDTINVVAGTYTETLNLVGKDNLTITGAGEGSTIIDAHLSAGYGWDLRSSGVTLSGFTFVGPSAGTYGIKVAGNSPTPATNFSILNVTIQNSTRTGLDINGVNGVTVTNVTVTGTTHGNGIGLTDVNNATLTNVTTSGNAWGSIAIMTYGRYFPGGSDHVTLTNITHDEVIYWEQANYTTPASPYPVTNFSAPQLGYSVTNLTDHPDQVIFTETLDEATTLANNTTLFPHPQDSITRNTTSGHVVVVAGASLQDAIDAAPADSTLEVAAGTYTEQLTINKNLHLTGAGIGASIIKAPASLPDASQPTSVIILISGSGVNVELDGFTVTGPGPTGCGSIRAGLFVRDGADANIHDNRIQDIRDSSFSGCQNGIAILVGRQAWSTSGTATISNNTIIGYQKGAIVVDNTGSNATISNNTITGAGTTAVIAQNGIQISRGATATLTGNTVTGNSFHLTGNASDWGSTGVLIFQGGAVTLAGGNSLSGNDQNLDKTGSSETLTLGAETLGGSSAPAGTGFDIVNDDSQPIDATHVTFTGAADGFAIEDRISDALDASGPGLVTWSAGNVYVTSESGSIQRGIDAASAGDTVHVAPGTYRENLLIPKALTLAGADQATTIVQPAVSNPNCGGAGGSSLCSGASNVILVQAGNVTIHTLTVDGDNPTLTSGITAGGADLDARNGIITNHALGTYNALEVYDTTVKNIYLRGLYASSSGTFNFHDNTVTNVQGDPASVAIFDWVGTGTIQNNTVSFAGDAIAANHSKGVQFLNNTVTHSGSGVHTDNAGDSGGVADLIQGNTVSDCTANGYGVWVFVPYIAPTFDNNTVTNCAVGLSAWGQGAAVTTQFKNNTVHGPAKAAGSVGAYVTTDMVGFGYSDSFVSFSGNTLTDNETGVLLDAGPQSTDPTFVSKTVNAAFHTNQITGNTNGAGKSSTGTIVNDLVHNWWGAASGPNAPDNAQGTGNPVVSGINYSPWCADAACTSFHPPFPLTVTADNQSKNVGDPDPTFTFGYDGFVNGDTASVIDTPPTCGVSGAHSSAGTYPIVCSGGADDRYTISYVDGTLTVNAVNNPPTDIALSSSAVDENQPAGTTVGTLTTTDPDAGDTVFTYSLVSAGPSCPGTDNTAFQITGSTLKTNAVFDYETQNSYVICIRTDDGHAGLFQEPFTIAVNNLTEQITLNAGSVAGQDGWILESSENSGVGGSLDKTSQSVRVGDDDQDRQYRAFLSFDTRSLPDNAVIDSVILRLKKTTGAGVSPFKTHGDLMVDITKPYFGPAKSLQIGDFQAAGTVSGKVNPTPVNALYLAVLPRPAFTLINPAGYTQIRLRFKLGDNDNMVANYLSFFSGNATNPNVRPVLVIVYHLP